MRSQALNWYLTVLHDAPTRWAKVGMRHEQFSEKRQTRRVIQELDGAWPEPEMAISGSSVNSIAFRSAEYSNRREQ